jgi:hypothetical protein
LHLFGIAREELELDGVERLLGLGFDEQDVVV